MQHHIELKEVRDRSAKSLIAFLKGRDNSKEAVRRAMIACSAFGSWVRAYQADIHAQALRFAAQRRISLPEADA